MEKTITEIEPTAKVLKLLGDKTRLTMVALLMKRELCVCEFQEVFDMSQPSISQHLRKLKDFGLVKEARKGQWIYYSLNKYNEFFSIIEYVTKLVPDQEEVIKQIDKSNPTLRCGC